MQISVRDRVDYVTWPLNAGVRIDPARFSFAEGQVAFVVSRIDLQFLAHHSLFLHDVPLEQHFPDNVHR